MTNPQMQLGQKWQPSIPEPDFQELEPPRELVEYFKITNTFTSDLKIEDFTSIGENYNILSNIDQNIYLLKQLDELGFLQEENNMCDCGLGLGNSLFEFYLQSKKINKNFHFSGIEKRDIYVDFIKQNLLELWDNSIELINDDLMNIDYSKYNLIYSYSPFNNLTKIKSMWDKIIGDAKLNTIIIENSNSGLGHFDILSGLENLEKIDLSGVFVFRKVK